MGTKLYFCGLYGPPRPTLRTPWGSMDPRLRTYGLEDVSSVTCAFTFNIHKHLSLVVSLESTPWDYTKCCDIVFKPLLGLLVYCALSEPIKIIQSLVHFIPEIPIAYLDLVFSSDSNPPYIFRTQSLAHSKNRK